jgi:dolichol-phosphate mannosyltransferase
LKKIAITTPTYNEAKNIKKLIVEVEKICRQYPNISFNFLVIDDNSPDGTAKVVQKVAKEITGKNFKVEVLNRKKKEGIGKAYVHGFKTLLEKDYDCIIQMDADLSHDPRYLKNFIKHAVSGKDFVVATRYIKGGGTPDWGLHRKILSRAGNLYTRFILSSRITDYTGGYNLFSTDLLRVMDIDTLGSGGYGFLIELKYRALQHAKSFSEVAIIFPDRQHGSSKIPKSTLFSNFILVPKIRLGKASKKI